MDSITGSAVSVFNDVRAVEIGYLLELINNSPRAQEAGMDKF